MTALNLLISRRRLSIGVAGAAVLSMLITVLRPGLSAWQTLGLALGLFGVFCLALSALDVVGGHKDDAAFWSLRGAAWLLVGAAFLFDVIWLVFAASLPLALKSRYSSRLDSGD
jgi:hypothetical protein